MLGNAHQISQRAFPGETDPWSKPANMSGADQRPCKSYEIRGFEVPLSGNGGVNVYEDRPMFTELNCYFWGFWRPDLAQIDPGAI